METILGVTLWDKQRQIVRSVKENKETAVRSCNASGKTYLAGRIVPWWLLSWEDSIVVTTAPTGRQVREVLWREIRSASIGKNLFPEQSIQEVQIDLGPRWFAIGLSTDTPDQFQGFHSPHLLVIVDEASGVLPQIYEAIDGLKPKRILLLGNPLSNEGRFAQDFKTKGVEKIHISAYDVPNVREGKTIYPGLTTLEDITKIRDRYGEDSDVYRVRVLGDFPKTDADSLIAISDVSAAMEREVLVDAHFEKKMGVDVARFGDDRSVIVVRHMNKVVRKEAWNGLDLMQVTGQVMRIAKEEKILARNICVDEIGVGSGVIDRLKEQGWQVLAVNVAETAKDSEHYSNKRAEIYFTLKEWLKTAQIPRDDDFYELANIKYKFTSKGTVQLESKDDMKKRGLESPDVADALALTFAAQKMSFVGASPVSTSYYGTHEVPF